MLESLPMTNSIMEPLAVPERSRELVSSRPVCITSRRFPEALPFGSPAGAAVDRFSGIPPLRETRNYVTRIIRILNRRARLPV